MENGTTLVYQSYDESIKAFFDVFLIYPLGSEIVRMKYLYPNELQGSFVDHLKRDEMGHLVRTASFEEERFKDLRLDTEAILEASLAPASEPILSLLSKMIDRFGKNIEQRCEIAAHGLHKLLMPLLTFVVLFIPAPFCMRYSRNLSIFLIYSLSIFGYIVMTAFMDAALIMGESNVASPYLIIPFMVLPFMILAWRSKIKLGVI